MKELTSYTKKEILPSAQNFLEHVRTYIKEIGDTFFLIGCHLYEAQIYNYVEVLGYANIEELAEAEFDLAKSSTYNLIKVFKRFCARDEYGNYRSWINPVYKNYKYSQLVEMANALCLSVSVEEQIPPSTSVRVLKEYIKYVNKNPGASKNLPDWQADKKESLVIVSSSLENKQIDGQIMLEDVSSIETSSSTAFFQTFGKDEVEEINKNCGLLGNQLSKEKFIKRFRSRLRSYLFYYDVDNTKSPYMSSECTLDEVLEDVLDCLEIKMEKNDD